MICDLILRIKIVGKYFYFSSATFWFWSIKIWYLKLSIQAQTLKAVIHNFLGKVILKIWNPLQNIRGILLKMYYEIKLFQVYLLQSVPVLCIRKWCAHSEIWNITKFFKYFSFCQFIFYHAQVCYFLLINSSLHILMNKSRWILSLAVPCFVFNFKSRKSKQT